MCHAKGVDVAICDDKVWFDLFDAFSEVIVSVGGFYCA